MLVLLRSFLSQVKQHSEDLVLKPRFLFKHHNCEKKVVEQNNPQSTRELSFGESSPKGKGVRKVFTHQWTINRQKIFEMPYIYIYIYIYIYNIYIYIYICICRLSICQHVQIFNWCVDQLHFPPSPINLPRSLVIIWKI